MPDLRVVLAMLTILCALHSAAAEPRWLKIRSANFELFTEAGERKGRDAILHFEQVRGFFLKITKVAPGSGLPVRIVAFNSNKEYKPYRMNEFAAAYAMEGQDRDYIVMGGLGAENYPVAVHEYVHLLLRPAGNSLPLWLDEGLAELYSTLKPVGNKVEIGHLLPGRYLVLRSSKWLDLETLTKAGHDSPQYNNKDLAPVFYAESWALTHMLTMTEGRRLKFGDFLAALAEGSQEAAFERAYGKKLREIWTDLQAYMRRGEFNYGVYDFKLEKAAERPEVLEADPVERGVVLAGLLGNLKRWGEAKQAFEQLAREHPASAEVEEGFGYAALRCRENEAALAHFARAAALGSSNARFYYDCANLMQSSGKAGSSKMLRKAVELDPGFLQAQFRLGLSLMAERDYEGAIRHLLRVRKVDREDAFPLFYSLAYAYQATGNPGEALRALARAKEYADSERQIETVNRLREYLERPQRTDVTRVPSEGTTPRLIERFGVSEEAPEQTAPPRITRAGETEILPVKPEPALPSIEGTLDQVDCLGEKARLRIRFQGRPVKLLIVDPTSVSVQGADAPAVDLACGPQQPRQVKIAYEPKVDGELGTIGIVRKMEFIRK
jgi:tetratricopeptide (TPR) repeat protein